MELYLRVTADMIDAMAHKVSWMCPSDFISIVPKAIGELMMHTIKSCANARAMESFIVQIEESIEELKTLKKKRMILEKKAIEKAKRESRIEEEDDLDEDEEE